MKQVSRTKKIYCDKPGREKKIVKENEKKNHSRI